MVNKITKYQCEICNKVYGSEKEASDCEATGQLDLFPIGMVFAMYKDKPMVFAVVKQYPNNYGHHHGYSTWACRDTKYGDNAGSKNYCGLESWDSIYSPNKDIPAYGRMIKALEKAGIKPIDYKEVEK